MTGMNDEIRRRVVEEMERQKLTRYQLAKDIGVEAPNVSRLLNGRSGKVPESWDAIFKRLGLKLVVVKDD
jgi:transcriptional regulator with XRE-family HTH domain